MTGQLVIWRVAPGGSEIRSTSPGNRECGAIFGESRDWTAKFAERRGYLVFHRRCFGGHHTAVEFDARLRTPNGPVIQAPPPLRGEVG